MNRCPFCNKPGDLGTYDEEVGAYAHTDCSLSASWTDIEQARQRVRQENLDNS